jgi:hypothetical protein
MHLSRLDLHRRCRQQPEATKQLAPLELLQQGEELVGFAPEDTLPCRARLVDDHHIPGLGDGGDRRLFLSSTSRAEALEPGLPCLIPRFLCESAHGYHRSQ